MLHSKTLSFLNFLRHLVLNYMDFLLIFRKIPPFFFPAVPNQYTPFDIYTIPGKKKSIFCRAQKITFVQQKAGSFHCLLFFTSRS